MAQLPAMQETWVWSLVGKIPWRRERLPTPVFWPREFHGLYIDHGAAKRRTWLSNSHFLIDYLKSKRIWCQIWWLTYLKRPWCWERLKAGGEGDGREWDGWIASLTQWTWVWVNSGSWWWTGRPGVLQCIGSQRVGHDWATELNWWWLGVYHFQSIRNDSFPTIMSKTYVLSSAIEKLISSVIILNWFWSY